MSPNVGSHHFIEEKLGHSTQRVGCLLHFTELPPKNLMKSKYVDGPTKGPIGTGGPLGDLIRGLPENLDPYVDYTPIPSYVNKDLEIEVFKGRADLVSLFDSCISIGKKIS